MSRHTGEIETGLALDGFDATPTFISTATTAHVLEMSRLDARCDNEIELSL